MSFPGIRQGTMEQRLSLEFPGSRHLHPGPLQMYKRTDTSGLQRSETAPLYTCCCPSCDRETMENPLVTCLWAEENPRLHDGSPFRQDITMAMMCGALLQPRGPDLEVSTALSTVQDRPCLWLYYHPEAGATSAPGPEATQTHHFNDPLYLEQYTGVLGDPQTQDEDEDKENESPRTRPDE